MPRSDKGRTNSTFPSHTVNSIFPRTSYTGPLMPRVASSTAVVRPTPTPMQVSSPSFMQSLKDGFSFGAGAHMARHFVDRIFGSSTPTPAPTPTPVQSTVPISTAVDSTKPIGADQLLYHKCMQDGGMHETCKEYLV
jgi:hypothetical protein